MQGLGAASIASLAAIPGVQAGDHWLSGARVETPSQPNRVFSASRALAPAGVMASSASSVFDITISLDTDPQGDNDYKADSGAGDDAQNAFERRIEEFAKAVYQSTNGALKIGKVSIFRSKPGATRVNSADVLWDENCAADQGPRANPSGYEVAGKHIWMCTNWPGSSTMPDPKGGGYTLAHEWGHFAFGLYDEYAQEQCSLPLNIACPKATPRGDDTAAIPAIMNNQWIAASGTVPAGYTGGAADFLEHSTQNIHPHRSDSTGTNAQKRVFGESAWQTLTRDPATDPKCSGIWPFSFCIPKRTQYGTLVAPSDPNWLVKDDESTALSALDIRWLGDQVIDLSIDVSGSMYGTPLANAKTGANLLIDQFQPGTALGVSSFETGVRRNFAITDIPEPDTGVKAAAQAAVTALTALSQTSLYDGLMFSLNDTQAFDSKRPGLVYVLSDGGDNDSIANESSVISAYTAAGVPIIAFAYGSGAPAGTLQNMANATGGALYQSPTTVAEIQKALVSAQAQFSSNVLLSSGSVAAGAGAAITRIIPMDSSLASARVNLSYTGNQSDMVFSLLLPDGTDSGLAFDCEGAASCSATLDEAFFAANGFGDYQVQITNTVGQPKDVTVLVSATPAGPTFYDIAVGFSADTVTYPADMALRATVTRGPAIAGLDVAAKVTGPQGSIFDLTLLDDGNGADQVANDGTYSASIPYMANGIYSAVATASNALGKAQTTFEGLSISLREDGTAVIPTPTPVTENFVRVGSAAASVADVLADDHANDPTGGRCTAIADNNADTAGRIDAAGDADCFSVVPNSLSRPITLRVTGLMSGMDPVLTVYDHTGAVQVAEVDMATSESPSSGVTVMVPASELDSAGLILVVRHVDPSASTGGYAVSAGTQLTSDAKVDAMICSILGNDPKPSLLDQDIFEFRGKAGDALTITLEKDTSGTTSGDRASLILKQKGKLTLLKLDRSDLPNKVDLALPRTGTYQVIVGEEPKIFRGKQFRGNYCLTLGGPQGTLETFKPTAWVE